VIVTNRSTYDEDGTYCRVIEFDEDQPFDTVLVRFNPERENIFTVRATDDGETVYTNAFEIRELSFDPISVLGMGERDRLTGVSENSPEVGGDTRQSERATDGGDDHLPDSLAVALNSLGFAPVPRGEDWL
jgi:hypothetical protein